jgi:hypothetical protein
MIMAFHATKGGFCVSDTEAAITNKGIEMGAWDFSAALGLLWVEPCQIIKIVVTAPTGIAESYIAFNIRLSFKKSSQIDGV